jgi:hypothetical protein
MSETASDAGLATRPGLEHYLRHQTGYGTLDHLAEVLWERTGAPDTPSVADIKQRIIDYGADALWDTLVGPMLDRMEEALELHLRSCSECGRRYTTNGDGTTNHLVEGSTEQIDYDADEDHVAYGDDL